jgi:hypothetical protein
MYKRYMKSIAVVVLLISLISISSAAVPRALPDIYTGQCGVQLSVAAPGLLKNDISSGKPLHVLAWTTPTLGTLTVDPSGSFIYNPPQNIASGTYVLFNYTATDGTTVTNQALVKIQVACSCRGAAPDVNVCLGTAISPAFLMSKGAACNGCRDATPKFDLSKIPAQPVAGQTYPYTVSCPNCVSVTGHVHFNGACTISSSPFAVCSGETPSEADIRAKGSVTCSCDTTPAISEIHLVNDDHWEYTITCRSECGQATATGTVNIDASCVPTIEFSFPIPTDNCPGHVLPTSDYIKQNGGVSCGCGGTLEISDIHWVEPTPSADNEWVGNYKATCRSANGCEKSDIGQFTSDDCVGFDCSALNCDDGNVCTEDSCTSESGCVHTNVTEGTSCSDGVYCNGAETCNANGVCQSGTPVTCTDDGNACTNDVCNEAAKSCGVDVAAGTSCSDGVYCNGAETCTANGVCQSGTPVTCPDDGNACTNDVCNEAAKSCGVNVAAGTSCSDDVFCNGAETCNGNGVCQSGTPVTCPNDHNACTNDVCNEATQSCGVTVADGTSCIDGKTCTHGDKCEGGVCVGTPEQCDCDDLIGCTVDACDPANPSANPTTGCVHTNNCDSGVCCSSSSGGSCVPDCSTCGRPHICTS